jgi:hypothetical protein
MRVLIFNRILFLSPTNPATNITYICSSNANFAPENKVATIEKMIAKNSDRLLPYLIKYKYSHAAIISLSASMTLTIIPRPLFASNLEVKRLVSDT